MANASFNKRRVYFAGTLGLGIEEEPGEVLP